MLFSSVEFLFGFLTVVLVAYYLLYRHRKLQNILLCLVSIAFYAWGGPVYALLMLGSILVNWWCGLHVADVTAPHRRRWLVGSVVLNLSVLFVFKYLNFVQDNICGLLGVPKIAPEIALPIGISFFTFQAMSYVIDVYRGQGRAQKSPLNVALYISFFPQLIAGPIVRYETIDQQIDSRIESWGKFQEGVQRFMLGLVRKVLLANHCGILADSIFNAQAEGQAFPVWVFWLGAICYALQIYHDFAGYSDMAIGLGKMFGFDFLENFDKPYFSRSVAEFWRRWHISLGSWFRDYVYIPLGGNRVTYRRHIFNLFVVWLCTGIWHGANWTFICWGLYYFLLLTFEKETGFPRGCWWGRLYTMLSVLIGWVLFRAASLPQAVAYLGGMLGIGTSPMWSETALLQSNWPYLILAIVWTVGEGIPWTQKMQGKVKLVENIALSVGFLLSVAELFASQYNPFIYFNF